MRGALPHTARAYPRIGIIPADAGSTRSSRCAGSRRGDHPRGCGEHPEITVPFSSSTGSSPRMRGAPVSNPDRLMTTRIIPADAGSTRCLSIFWSNSQDHPRGCGEHGGRGQSARRVEGSSPRMRGAPDSLCKPIPRVGIIPADAGSTRQSLQANSKSRDHPRGCGEHLMICVKSYRIRGSSPRMRGAQGVAGPSPRSAGIIPADAGST